MADGSVIIDTKLDPSGLKKGLAQMGSVVAAGVATSVAALGAMTAAAVKVGIDFESAFAGVKKTVDATEEELEGFRSGILDMSREIPIAATEIAGIAEAAGQLGIQNDALLSFTETMANLGVATNMTSEQAATSLARLANITGMSQSDFDRLGSVIVDLGNNLATTESEIVEMALRLAGTGKQVGMTEDQILSLSAAASSVGLYAEAGGSAFSRVLSMMQLSAEQGGESLQAFADVAGMSASEFKTAFETDAAGALVSFIQGLGDAEARGESAIGVISQMGEVAGLSALDTITVRDALLRAAGASDVFAESLEIGSEAWAENTALVNEASQRYETMESQLQLLQNSATTLGIAVYDSLRESMTEMVSFAAESMDLLNEAFNEGGFQGLSSAIGTVLADAAAMVLDFAPTLIEAATGLIEGLISGILENAPALIDSVIQIGAMLLEAFVSLAPQLMEAGAELIFQLAAGIIENLPALADGAMQAVEGFCSGFAENLPLVLEKGQELLNQLCLGIQENLPSLIDRALDAVLQFSQACLDNAPTIIAAGFQLLSSLVQGILDALPDLLSKGPEIISNFANVINNAFPQILQLGFDLLCQIIEGILKAIPDLIANIPKIINAIIDVWMAFDWLSLGNKAIKLLGDGIKAAKGLVTNAGKNILQAITTAISQLPQNLMNLGSNAIQFMGNKISAMRSVVASAGADIFNAIVNAVKSLPSAMLDIGQNIVQGIWNGISGAAGWLIGQVKSFCSRVLNSIKSFFGIASPSKVFRDMIGKNLMYGLANGISAAADTAIGAAQDVADDIKDIDFEPDPGDPPDYDALVATAQSVVRHETVATAEAVSAGSASRSYGTKSADAPEANGGGKGEKPKYIQNDIHIDGKKTARVITPYVAKELDWEGK